MIKVAKFGGSSLSSGEQFQKVKDIILADDSMNVIICSAPGKRHTGDSKVTDLLYLCKAHLKYDVPLNDIFQLVKDRFNSIKSYCNINFDLSSDFANIERQLSKNISEDLLASRGEFLNGKLLASFLGYKFIDAKDIIFFNYDGSLNISKTYTGIKEICKVYNNIVIPGFYGSLPNGDIKVFGRGGSDITGSIVAAALDADIYENWTDVSGILMADPKIVENPKTISRVTYSELRELSYMGASVLHEEAVFPVREKDIPINIRNTNSPSDAGTIIRENFPEESDEEKLRFITGITGKKDFSIINVYKETDAPLSTVLIHTLKVLNDLGISVSQVPSSIDSFSVVVPTFEFNSKRHEIVAKLNDNEFITDVKTTDGLSVIAIVGRQMAYRSGISGKIFGTLGANNINIRTILQSSDEINIMITVKTEDFAKATRTLYESFAK